MSSAAHELDPELPNLRPEVAAAYRAAPTNVIAEVIAGELYTMTRPRPEHQSATGELYSELRDPFRRGRGGPGGWLILTEIELRLGDHPEILEPDLAGWRRERLPTRPTDPFIVVPPDWVCEVLSDSTRRHDRRRKLPVYFLFGVKHVWLLDPAARTLEVFRAAIDGYDAIANFSEDDKARAEPFDAIELDLAALWAW